MFKLIINFSMFVVNMVGFICYYKLKLFLERWFIGNIDRSYKNMFKFEIGK